MITLTRFDTTNFILNCDIIQYVEKTPDTIITLTTGDKLIVKESCEDVIEKVVEYKRSIFHHPPILDVDDSMDVIE